MNDIALASDVQSHHWMSRMLSPQSIAIVGASPRTGSMGQVALQLLQDNFYAGKIYLVNPRYEAIGEFPAYPDLHALPESPDLVLMVIGSASMEAAVDACIEVGAGGVVIFSNNFIENDSQPPLLDRLKARAREADMPVCGGNGMGFYNYDANCLVSFDFPPRRDPGGIAFIAHSGSAMTYLANNDPRLKFNLVVSPGQEINGTVADYMAYALTLESTRVVAIFIETVRDPDTFIEALRAAREQGIPVVVVKIGATEKSARMAASHSGAVAGSDTAFQALCDRYGVIRVRDLDELAATALLLSHVGVPGPGKLSSLLDSGGLREMMIDLSADHGVEFAELEDPTRDRLKTILEYGLVAENPVDAMGSINADVVTNYRQVLEILDDDPGTGLISLEFEFRDGFSQYPPAMLDMAIEFSECSKKPLVVVNSTTSISNSQDAVRLGRHGIPVINGISNALAAIGHAFSYRDHPGFDAPEVADGLINDAGHWRSRLAQGETLDETSSLELLAAFDLPTVTFARCNSLEAVLQAGGQVGYPTVLKSAATDLFHKSDAGGVALNLENPQALAEAYREMNPRLGADVLVMPMVRDGVELGFGMVNDPQFGPQVMVCAGGIYIELLDDRKFVTAPFGEEEALRHIQSLAIHRILEGSRGNPPCRVDLAARALSRFSKLAWVLRDEVAEIDLNPVVVTPSDCRIVDALVVPLQA